MKANASYKLESLRYTQYFHTYERRGARHIKKLHANHKM